MDGRLRAWAGHQTGALETNVIALARDRIARRSEGAHVGGLGLTPLRQFVADEPADLVEGHRPPLNQTSKAKQVKEAFDGAERHRGVDLARALQNPDRREVLVKNRHALQGFRNRFAVPRPADTVRLGRGHQRAGLDEVGGRVCVRRQVAVLVAVQFQIAPSRG